MGERFDNADVHAATTALADDVTNFSSTADMSAAIAADGQTPHTALDPDRAFVSGVGSAHAAAAAVDGDGDRPTAAYGQWVADFQAAHQQAAALPVSTATPLGGHCHGAWRERAAAWACS